MKPYPDLRLNSSTTPRNYDVNIILVALQTLDYAAVWWVKRRRVVGRKEGCIMAASTAHYAPLLLFTGLWTVWPYFAYPISLGFLSVPITRKHQIAVRQINGVYYNLDSKLKSPSRLGGGGGQELR
ncbi:josephin-2-like [Anomaloglossus baeobatrachus]